MDADRARLRRRHRRRRHGRPVSRRPYRKALRRARRTRVADRDGRPTRRATPTTRAVSSAPAMTTVLGTTTLSIDRGARCTRLVSDRSRRQAGTRYALRRTGPCAGDRAARRGPRRPAVALLLRRQRAYRTHAWAASGTPRGRRRGSRGDLLRRSGQGVPAARPGRSRASSSSRARAPRSTPWGDLDGGVRADVRCDDRLRGTRHYGPAEPAHRLRRARPRGPHGQLQRRRLDAPQYMPVRGRHTRRERQRRERCDNVARGQFDTPHREEFDVLRHLTRVTDHARWRQRAHVHVQDRAAG